MSKNEKKKCYGVKKNENKEIPKGGRRKDQDQFDQEEEVSMQESSENEDSAYDFDIKSEDDEHPGKIATEDSSEQSTKEVFDCETCAFVAPNKEVLWNHLRKHKVFICSICEHKFKSRHTLQNHINAHIGKKPHKCDKCAAAFTTTGDLMRHIRYKHTKEKPHKCTECDYSSVELSKLRRHFRTHTGERPYKCPHCTYASPDNFKLKRHLRVHTGEKPYVCDICNVSFSQLNSMKMHRTIHSSNKMAFQCPECPVTCGRKNDLRLHILNLHNKNAPMECKRCGRVLPDRYQHKLHVRTHEGEKSFKCAECNYAATTERLLELHMSVHVKSLKYECSDCGKAFKSETHLKYHARKSHSETYIARSPRQKINRCPHCQRSFAHKGNLMRHMKVHDPAEQNNATTFKTAKKVGAGSASKQIKESTLYTIKSEGIEELDEVLEIVPNTAGKEKQEFDFVVDVPGETTYSILEVDEELSDFEDNQYVQIKLDDDCFDLSL